MANVIHFRFLSHYLMTLILWRVSQLLCVLIYGAAVSLFSFYLDPFYFTTISLDMHKKTTNYYCCKVRIESETRTYKASAKGAILIKETILSGSCRHLKRDVKRARVRLPCLSEGHPDPIRIRPWHGKSCHFTNAVSFSGP